MPLNIHSNISQTDIVLKSHTFSKDLTTGILTVNRHQSTILTSTQIHAQLSFLELSGTFFAVLHYSSSLAYRYFVQLAVNLFLCKNMYIHILLAQFNNTINLNFRHSSNYGRKFNPQ